MPIINRNPALTNTDIELFIESIDFQLPQSFIEFYKETNGADLSTSNAYVILWPLTDFLRLNQNYKVNIYAPEFFIFGSDGGDMAYAIERTTGYIFEMPFIGMSKEEAVFKNKDFNEFIEAI